MKVVTFGGGTGQPMVLRAIKSYKVDIAAVVSMADSGGSSGVLRDELGVLPPSDALRCLLALADMEDPRAALLAVACRHRFEGNGSLAPDGIGHTAGNILLTALLELHRENAFGIMGQLLAVPHYHQVLPSTLSDVALMAELEDGSIISGETGIDCPVSKKRSPIKKVWLNPQQASATPAVIKAIKNADIILIPPGDLYTSIIASLLPDGIVDAISASRARLVMCVNTMTKEGETSEYTALSHVETVERYVGRRVDVVICNTGLPDTATLQRYINEGKHPVIFDILCATRRVICADLLIRGELARHDPALLGHILNRLFAESARDFEAVAAS